MNKVYFWITTLMGANNIMIAGLRASRQKEPMLWLSFATIAVAIVALSIAQLWLQNAFSAVGNHLEETTARRYQAGIRMIGFMANLAILSAFAFNQ